LFDMSIDVSNGGKYARHRSEEVGPASPWRVVLLTIAFAFLIVGVGSK